MKTKPVFANLRKTTLAMVVVAALCGAAALDADAATAVSNAFATVAHPTALRNGDAVIGALPMTQPLHVVVALKMRNRDVLDAFIANNAKIRTHGGAPQSMTSDQLLANHAPTQTQAQEVADYLKQTGFTHVVIAPNRLLVSAEGTVATARDAFMTTFAQVRTHDGRIAFANTDDVRIPAALSDKILSVLGLQNVHQGHTFARPLARDGAHTEALMGHFPTEFSSIYGGTGVAAASSVTVGIATEGKLTQVIKDLNIFTANHSLPTVTTQTVNTDGTSTDATHISEFDLDSQNIVGMAGGQVGKLIFYNMPSLEDDVLTDDFNTIVVANKAKIINVSIGLCETDEEDDGAAFADDQIFAVAVAQGQTFSISTGDSGADECPDDGLSSPVPSWPAASQYVIAAAGTSLTASTTTWSSETVWKGSGGSPSTFEPKPSWQDALVPGSTRGVADIAFDADPNSGSEIIVNGVLEQYGGTSLSAPLFAGLWARVLQQHPTIGFAGPQIYALPATDFHDITSGNNGGETAKAGYDFASGRGSIILSSAIANLGNKPPVANFSDTTSALTANFTDSSTDSDGTIASHAWTFGDGSTSTLANPSHTYAAANTYSVTETVTDNDGATNSKTESVVVNNQLLGNTGFETGKASPWTAPTGTISNSASEPAHTGSWDAWLNGKGTANTVTLAQQVAIPSGVASATLSFYLHVDTAETTGKLANDTLTVLVTSPTGTVLGTLATFSNLNHAGKYGLHTFDMTPYIGQTVKLKFTGKENATLQTSFVLDDITLTVH